MLQSLLLHFLTKVADRVALITRMTLAAFLLLQNLLSLTEAGLKLFSFLLTLLYLRLIRVLHLYHEYVGGGQIGHTQPQFEDLIFGEVLVNVQTGKFRGHLLAWAQFLAGRASGASKGFGALMLVRGLAWVLLTRCLYTCRALMVSLGCH